jgi:hypothetical protein
LGGCSRGIWPVDEDALAGEISGVGDGEGKDDGAGAISPDIRSAAAAGVAMLVVISTDMVSRKCSDTAHAG